MRNCGLPVLLIILIANLFLFGCVERKLTINTEPQGALVTLNDEEIGPAPVTVPFNWYGDYNVRISKAGYETLNTHRELKSPLHDYFPFDIFAQISPSRTVDSYEWTFTLKTMQPQDRDQLIENAKMLEQQLNPGQQPETKPPAK